MGNNLKWYAIKVVSGQEKKVKTYLENEIARQKLDDFVTKILLPTEKVYVMRNGKKIIREKNMMPGYMIISADISHGEARHVVQNIPGIIGFIGTKTQDSLQRTPVPLRQTEINRILGKVDESENFEERLDIPFIVGESVKLVDGAFSGFTGNVEEVYEERKKLKVMVLIFGRKTPVVLDYLQVEKED